MGSGRTWMLGSGMVIGAAAAYLFDPDNGRRRRSQMMDMAAARTRRASRAAEGVGTQAMDRARGMAHEATSTSEPPPSDRALVDKVRSEVLGGPEWRPYTINVDAVDGVVALRGQVERSEQVDQLREAVAAVPGVRAVENYLHLPGTPAPNVQHVREQ